jgi:hypothetical protein
MSKVRVYELAKELGIESKFVIARLTEIGEFVRSASSTVKSDVAIRLRNELAGPDVPSDAEPQIPMQAAGTNVALSDKKSEGRVVRLHGLSSDVDVDNVIRACRSALRSNSEFLTLDMSDASGFYPSAAVPVAAILEYSRSRGLRAAMTGSSAVLDKMSVRNPIEASPQNLAEYDPLSRVWVYFDHRQANYMTNGYMDTIRRRVVCKPGVLEALEWCLYEVLDNVMQHSESGQGFVMMQLHSQSHRLAFAVADAGLGVQRSLAMSDTYKPKTSFDALTMAIEEGVTRDKVANQGNGLFGLFRIIEQNNGRLTMRSGRGRMRLQGNRITGDNDAVVLSRENPGTFLDVQMAVDRPVSMNEALNYRHVNDFLENLESEERGCHVVKIREHAGGTGSRAAAKELRIFLENVSISGAELVELDFSGQAVVSSSFADEVIGKLVASLGFTTFNQKYRLSNMNQTVAGLLDRAIAKRLGSA